MTPVIDRLNADRKDLPLYMLGNCLRGYVYGRFADQQEAFDALSARFDKSYPSLMGRTVEFWCCLSSTNTALASTQGASAVEPA